LRGTFLSQSNIEGKVITHNLEIGKVFKKVKLTSNKLYFKKYIYKVEVGILLTNIIINYCFIYYVTNFITLTKLKKHIFKHYFR